MKNKTMTIGLIVCAVILIAAVGLSVSGIFGLNRYTYENADSYTAGGTDAIPAAGVRNISVDWLDGKVTLARHGAQTIALSEVSKKEISDDLQLRWWVDGDTLRVRYAKSGAKTHSLFGGSLNKELTLTLPEGFAAADVYLHTTSGDLIVPALDADALTLDVTSGTVRATAAAGRITARATSGDISLTSTGAAKEIGVHVTSGNIAVEAVTADTLKAEMTSGSISVTAERIGDFSADATSGDVSLRAAAAERIKVHTTSGRITVSTAEFSALDASATSGNMQFNLPAEPGFTARVEKTSGNFTYGVPLTMQGSDYVCGDGSASVKIHVTSGDIRIDPYQ